MNLALLLESGSTGNGSTWAFGVMLMLLLSLPRQPPVGESHWRMLLQDMLTMQQQVYTCLTSNACYEVTATVTVFFSHSEIFIVFCPKSKTVRGTVLMIDN